MPATSCLKADRQTKNDAAEPENSPHNDQVVREALHRKLQEGNIVNVSPAFLADGLSLTTTKGRLSS